MTTRLTLCRPDDWHLHLRDGEVLADTVAAVSGYFGRAIVMPNLTPPITTLDALRGYRQRLVKARPPSSDWQPLMTLYLTDETSPSLIVEGVKEQSLSAVKWYPAGATTNSQAGVKNHEKLFDTLAVMEEVGLPLLIHGESTDPSFDIFDREKQFIDSTLVPLMERFSNLKIVLEHITTKDAVDFVKAGPSHLGATLTPQHILFNRNDLLVGGVKPHLYCLPILKRNSHQQAIREVLASGHHRFFLGTDSAPHAVGKKQSACGCAGCYSGYAALECYAQAFEELGALSKLEGFASHYGADFYGLPRNTDTITLVREPWQVPAYFNFGADKVVPLLAGETLNWQVKA